MKLGNHKIIPRLLSPSFGTTSVSVFSSYPLSIKGVRAPSSWRPGRQGTRCSRPAERSPGKIDFVECQDRLAKLHQASTVSEALILFMYCSCLVAFEKPPLKLSTSPLRVLGHTISIGTDHWVHAQWRKVGRLPPQSKSVSFHSPTFPRPFSLILPCFYFLSFACMSFNFLSCISLHLLLIPFHSFFCPLRFLSRSWIFLVLMH